MKCLLWTKTKLNGNNDNDGQRLKRVNHKMKH